MVAATQSTITRGHGRFLQAQHLPEPSYWTAVATFEHVRTNELSDDATAWLRQVLTALDDKDVDAYTAFMGTDVEVIFNNGEMAMSGRDAVRQGLSEFWQSFGTLRHDELNIDGEDRRFVHEALNYYTTLDGREVTIRAVAWIDRDDDGRITSLRIYNDSDSCSRPASAETDQRTAWTLEGRGRPRRPVTGSTRAGRHARRRHDRDQRAQDDRRYWTCCLNVIPSIGTGSKRSRSVISPSGPSKRYSLSIRTIGIRRRSAASARRDSANVFSLCASTSRAVVHSSCDTMCGALMSQPKGVRRLRVPGGRSAG